VDLNRAWKTIRENIKISAKESLGYYELMQHKPWFGKNVQNYWGIFAQSKNCGARETAIASKQL
jgi:hypothetical protein